jgi:hypothetical protein
MSGNNQVRTGRCPAVGGSQGFYDFYLFKGRFSEIHPPFGPHLAPGEFWESRNVYWRKGQ